MTDKPLEAIAPPLADADVPFVEYAVDAGKGGFITPASGTVITFPPHAFVDAQRYPVQGNVRIRYREFPAPAELYLSGIPMRYDSLGTQYDFESSAMCEIRASMDGKPVFVNPAARPELKLAARKRVPTQNVYYYDQVRNEWVYKGERLRSESALPIPLPEDFHGSVPKPVPPQKASGSGQIIHVLIDTSSFASLGRYHNLRFQVEEGEPKMDPDDTLDTWDDVGLLPDSGENRFLLRFVKGDRKLVRKVKPVFSASDYPEAMRVYNREMARYNTLARLTQQADSTNARYVRARDARDAPDEAIQRFQIDGFGIWNCDRPLRVPAKAILAHFTDERGAPVELKHIALINKKLNSIFRLSANNFNVPVEGKNLIVGVAREQLFCTSWSDLSAMSSANGHDYRFVVKPAQKSRAGYESLRLLINNP